MTAARFVALAALALPAAATAQSRAMTTLWIVQPAPEEGGRTKSVKGGELILKQRVLPTAAARLTGEVADLEGKFVFAPGAELFAVAADQKIYCVAGLAEKTGVAKWLASGANGQLCLVDADADSRFEGYFTAISMISGLPTVAGNRPKQAKPLPAPVGYEPLDPAKMVARYWVGIEYQGKPLLYNRRNFTVSFGSDAAKGSLTDWVYTGGTFPASQTLLGAKWTVQALEDGGRVKVTIDAPIPAQPFGVMHTVSYRIY